jgi:heat shock protein HslJ
MITTRIATLAALALTLTAACSRRPTSETEAAASATGASIQLRGTYWKLTSLGDRTVNVAESQREPHLILQADSKQVIGSGGCNRMFGSYELNGDALTFGDVGSTKMACPDVMDVENSFLPALQRVAKWRISGQQLDLLDSGGARVARFDAKRSS